MQHHADEILAEPVQRAAQRFAQSRRFDRRRFVENRLARQHQHERHQNAGQYDGGGDGFAVERQIDARIAAVEAAPRVRYQAQLDDGNPGANWE